MLTARGAILSRLVGPRAVSSSNSTRTTSSSADDDSSLDNGGLTREEQRGQFRVLDIGLRPPPPPRGPQDRRGTRRGRPGGAPRVPDREKLMSPEQSWESVWPAPRTFHPSVVPLPVRQGFIHLKSQVHPGKHANVELMKIPNFLHLTPPAIRRQCAAIKKFCTDWPEGDVEKEFPATGTTSAYLNASSSIRDHRARVFSIKFPLSSLELPVQAKEKFIRLVGERYDPVEDSVTITCDSCPHLRQNKDHAEYLVTALYHESLRREPWEEEAFTERDEFWFSAGGERGPVAAQSEQHAKALSEVLNEGESGESISAYKNAVLDLLKKAGNSGGGERGASPVSEGRAGENK